MTDIASLAIQIDSTQVTSANAALNTLATTGANTERAVGGMSNSFAGLSSALSAARNAVTTLAPMLGGLAFGALAADVLQVNREMQTLRTSLETVTGSAANANAAFKQIQAFAASTPYSVQQVTEAFIKLGNFGLKPTEATLTSFGNTASAMGKSLDQMVMAVTDATTGQFERLKEFGINASKQGDQVAFTFHGITTTVKNSADDIQAYLQKIGDVDFAGGMERQSQTIDGALSNLGDSWNNLLDNIITPSSERMIATLISGTAAGINAIGNLSETTVTFGNTTATVGEYIQSTWNLISSTATNAINAISTQFPIIGTTASAVAKFVGEVFSSAWHIVVDVASMAFNAVVGIVNGTGQALGVAAAGIVQVFSQAFGRIKDMASGLALGIEAALAGDLSFSALSTAYKRETLTFKQVNADVGQSFKDAFKQDYIGDFTGKIKAGAAQLHSMTSELHTNATAAHGVAAAHNAAGAGAGKHAAAQRDVSDAAKEASKQLQNYKNLTEAMFTPAERFNSEMSKYVAAYNAGGISLDTFNRALAKYSDELASASTNGFIAVTAQEKLNDAYQKASDLFASGKISQAGYAQQLGSATSTFDTAKNGAQNKALAEYDALINKIDASTKNLGATNSAVFDGALGGINTLVGAFTNMGKSIDSITASQNELAKAYAKSAGELTGTDAEKRTKFLELEGQYTKANTQLESEKTDAALTGARQIIGATASLFDKKSSAAKALHAIEQGIAVAQLAINATTIASNIMTTLSAIPAGVSQMFAQSGWAGFAGAAAFLALLAGLGFSSGGGGGGGSVSMPSPTTGTVLGDSSKSSESTQNVIATLKDIHASEYRELRSLNENFVNLGESIKAAVASVFQSGGLQTNFAGIGKVDSTLSNVASGIIAYMTLGLSELLKGIPLLGQITGWLTDGLFGSTKTSVKEVGIATSATKLLTAQTSGVNPQQYQINHVKESGALFGLIGGGEYDTKPAYSELNESLKFSINEVFKLAAKTFSNESEILGGSFDTAIKDYIFPALQIDIKDLKGDDAVKKITSSLNTALDDAAKIIFAPLKQYQKLGEGMKETVDRLAIDMGILKNSMEMVGVPIKSVTLETIAYSEALVSHFDDLKTMRNSFEDFFNKFFTTTEKNAYTLNTLNGVLDEFGYKLPATRDGWKQLVQQELAAGTGHEKGAASLLKATSTADQYYTSVEDGAKSMQGAQAIILDGTARVDAANRATADGMAFLQNMAFGAGKTLDNFNLTLDVTQSAGANVAKAFGNINEAMQTFVSLGEKINGKDWATAFNLAVAQGQTDVALNRFNSASGFKADRGTIRDMYANGGTAGVAFAQFSAGNPELGALALDVLKAYDKELGISISTITTSASSTAGLNTAQTEAARIASERTGLETQLLQLQGNTAELRKRELDALDPSNRELKLRIYALEDEKTAQAELVKTHQALSDAAAVLKQKQDSVTANLKGVSTAFERLNDSALAAQLHSLSDQTMSTLKSVVDNGGTLQDAATIIDTAMRTGGDAFEKAAKAVQDSYAAIHQTIATKGFSISDEITKLTAPSLLAEVQRQRAISDLSSKNYQTQLAAVDTLHTLIMDNYAAEQDKLVKIKEAAKQIGDYIDKFKVGSLSTLSPENKLAEAKAQYATQLSMAKAGDPTALGQVTGAFDTYAQAAKDYYASTEPYQRIIADGLDELSKLSSTAQDPAKQTAVNTGNTVDALRNLQRSIESIDIQQTASMNAEITTLRTTTTTIAKQFLDSVYALGAAYNVGQGQIAAALNAIAAQKANLAAVAPPSYSGTGINDKMIRPGTYYPTDTPGMDAFLAGDINAAKNAAEKSGLFTSENIDGFLSLPREQQLINIANLKKLGMTFASGGSYLGGLALVGEQGPELINFRQPGQVYTAQQTRQIISGGDNSDVVDELQQLRAENMRLQQAMLAQLQQLERRMSQIEHNGALAGAQ